MKVLFKNITKYTKENRNNFIEFHTKKYGKNELIKMILAFIMILYIIIFNIVYNNWIIILGFIVIGLIIYFFKRYSAQKISKKKRKVKEYTFYFYKNYIKIKCRREFERLSYLSLHKIFETEEYFYLYVDEKSSLILKKDGFQIGTPEGFSKFIKGKCPLKYKKIKEDNKKEI